MSRNPIFISYLDEHKIDFPTINGIREKNKYYTILSITVNKDDYINVIERNWEQLRLNYGINPGLCLHFTSIKYLLSTNPKATHDPVWKGIFSDTSGNIDYMKLFNFFKDIIDLLSSMPFIVQYTGIKTNTENLIRKNTDRNFRKNIYEVPYIAFKEHLNLMGIYLTNLNLDRFNSRDLKLTKLRYDGDIGLGERNDIKEAYHHSITLGTKHFRPEIVKQLFDEIRFIGKDEVGCIPISHAGNEIVDFITSVFSRDLWQIQTDRIELQFPLESPNDRLDQLTKLKGKVVGFQKLDDTSF